MAAPDFQQMQKKLLAPVLARRARALLRSMPVAISAVPVSLLALGCHLERDHIRFQQSDV
jgi:hypothetical protein